MTGNQIQTYTGKMVNPFALHPEDVDIHDIAHSLARTCRYGGHTFGYLSVARHSIWVSDLLAARGHPELALTGLLHDASEAYLGDIPRPIKHQDAMLGYRSAEAAAEAVIAKVFGTPHPLPDEVHQADSDADGDRRYTYRSTPDADNTDFLYLYARLTTPAPLPKIIGLAGYAQSGKDTVASMLAPRYGRRAFADALRDVLYALDPDCRHNVDYNDIRGVSTWVDEYGWEWAKANTEVRALLQRLGTEAGRKILGEDIWVKTAMRDLLSYTVFTDVRFPNEAQAIVDQGGVVWRVNRPGTGAVNGHPSETALDDWPYDLLIVNDGSLDDLQKQVDSVVR